MGEINKIDEIEAHCEMGEYCLGKEDNENALKIFYRVLELNKDNKIANFNIGNIKYVKKEYEEAAKRLTKVIEVDRHNGFAYRV